MIFIGFGITLIYFLLIASFLFGFDRIKTFELRHLKAKTRFSVIVPFRNEAKMLPALLESIELLNYPKDYFEIIFVDDDSDDISVDLINSFWANTRNPPTDFKVIKNKRTSKSPKKDALTLAISQAKYGWIVTTDADSVLPKYWLESFDEFIQTHSPQLIVAPITYGNTQEFLENFQLLDVLSLQGATIGGFGMKKPFLCNGANLAYTKELFKTLNGFDGNSDIASGDDVFLLEKAIQHNKSKVLYLKCEHSVVSTLALNSWSNLIEQRVRWAAKASAYNNLFGKLVGLIVFSQNALLVCSVLLVPIGIMAPQHLLFIFLIKLSIDFLLIYKAALFFAQKEHLIHYFLSSLCYPIFTVYVAFIAVFKGFKWKGRNYIK
ncbi:glycosyltransferase [Gelidibacter sp.]|uniref:glycosyltransferase n=1 Tax=Gelidibacter sp. TaxID=2018083 RepID=UPI002BE519CF|nr:glycosyltransferase [Gelidibacter sp.]HUH27318.1 glycosyltransferase [Gelidibacter sp.]